ncbi:hypothetical protein CVD23_18485 [Bacillus sp. V33-4]|nr:hypothetical protein CVD23_18485 [Bacillus sp. V33-4]
MYGYEIFKEMEARSGPAIKLKEETLYPVESICSRDQFDYGTRWIMNNCEKRNTWLKQQSCMVLRA